MEFFELYFRLFYSEYTAQARVVFHTFCFGWEVYVKFVPRQSLNGFAVHVALRKVAPVYLEMSFYHLFHSMVSLYWYASIYRVVCNAKTHFINFSIATPHLKTYHFLVLVKLS